MRGVRRGTATTGWALALLALTIAPLAAVPSALAQPTPQAAALVTAHWGPPGEERSVSPGDEGVTLTVVFVNERNQTFHFLRAEILDTEGIEPTFDDGDVDTFDGPYRRGDTWRAQFTVNINETVDRDEVIEVPLWVRMYTDPIQLTQANRRSEYPIARVPVLGSASVNIEATVTQLEASSKTRVPLVISNDGDGGATDIEVQLTPTRTTSGTTQGGAQSGSSGTLVITSGSHVRLNRTYLAPGKDVTTTIEVLAPEAGGTYTIDAQLTFTDASGNRLAQTRSLGFVVVPRTAPPLGVGLAETSLEADREDELHFVVTNEEGARLGAVTLDVRLPPGGAAGQPIVPAGPTTMRLGDLEAGASTTAALPVLVSATAHGTHALNAVMTWRDAEGLVQSWTFPLGVRVEGAIEISVIDTCAALDPEAPRLVAGGFVVNTGNSAAHNLAVRIVEADGVDASAPEVLDDVQPNSPRSFTIETRVDERGADGTPTTVALRIGWTDDDGRRDNATVQVPVTNARTLPADSLCEDVLDDASEDGGLPIPGPSPLALTAAALVAALALAARSRRR